jgi:hypothetical protein
MSTIKANDASVSLVSSSLSDIYKKYLNLAAAQNYLSPDGDSFGNLDFLRSGLFGWIMESFAMFTRDAAFQKTMLYNEGFLNTAVMPSSIYNWAKMFNLNVLDAVPAGRYITMTIPTDSLSSVIENIGSIDEMRETYGIDNTSNFIVLDKSNPIYAGTHYFCLEHSIEIYKQTTSNNYIVSYCVNEKNQTTTYGDYTNPIIVSNIVTSGSTSYLEFTVQAFQYKNVAVTKIITSNSVFDTKSHQFTYADQLCGLQVKYAKGSSSTKEDVTLKFSNIDLAVDEESTTKVAYYSLVDTDTLEIDFASSSNAGLPQSGGTIYLNMFETEGSGGNINFTGDAVFVLSQEDYRSIAITATIGDVIQSGKDQSTLGEIKNKVINKLSTRGVIITEDDLDNYFLARASLLSDVKDTSIIFKRETDNLIKRIFSAQLRLRDGVYLSSYNTSDAANAEKASATSDSYITSTVPTNTIDLTYTPSGDTSNTTGIYTIFPHIPISCYVSTDGTDVVYRNGESASSSTETLTYSYKTPFYIIVNTNQYHGASYYYTDVADSSPVSIITAGTGDSNGYFSVSTISLYHSSSVSSTTSSNTTYTLTLSGVSSYTATELKDSKFKSITLKFYKEFNLSNSADIAAKYSEVTATQSSDDSSLYTFTANIVFNIANDSPFSTDDGGNPIMGISFDSGTSIAAKVLSSEYVDVVISDGTEIRASNALTFFYALDDVMHSDVTVNYDTAGKISSFIVQKVPVVASWWINDSINKKWFIRQMNVYIQMLRQSSSILDINTFFAIRFANTYGYSKALSTNTTNLRLKLKIYLDSNSEAIYGQTFSVLEANMRDYLRMYVDKANNNGALDVSGAIASLSSYNKWASCILHVDFLGLNGSFAQYVKTVADTDIKEYFGLDMQNLSNDIMFDTSGTIYSTY